MTRKETLRLRFENEYKGMLLECKYSGTQRDDRTGVGCISIFSQSLTVDISECFPIITGRKISQKVFDTEFEWFINGETNIKRFQDAKVKIWDAWANEDGDLGPVYGYQMINFNNQSINQLEAVIHSLKTNPDSRRHIISLWNPAQLSEMALPPCYLYFQFFVDGDNLNMFVLQRSGDLFLGIPYDMALFSKLLLYIAEETGYKAKTLDVKIIDAHIYTNQLDAINRYIKEQIYPSPEYKYSKSIIITGL
jgi:thymidylate synthase